MYEVEKQEHIKSELKHEQNELVVTILKFSAWFERQTGKKIHSAIKNMSIKDKEETFLKWKHGLENHNANAELENTERLLLAQILRPDRVHSFEPNANAYYTKKIKFNLQCEEHRRILGLPVWGLHKIYIGWA